MESKHRFPQALENACAFPTFPPPRLLLSFIKTKRKNSCPRTGEILDCDHLMTDGQVSGTEAILARARTTNTRLHCLGIGSASQDRFLALLARESGVSAGLSRRESA